MPMAVEQFEDFRAYIVRYEDRAEWLQEARGGNETAKICQWAASNWMREMAEHDLCSCCERTFSPPSRPRAFIVLIPIKKHPEKVRAKAGGVCAECSKRDNRWIIDNGAHRLGLPTTPPGLGDKLH